MIWMLKVWIFVESLDFCQALKDGVREKVELATKYGIRYAEGKVEFKGDPAYVRAACEASLMRVDVACIDLYYQHRIDTRVPIEITVSTLLVNLPSWFCNFQMKWKLYSSSHFSVSFTHVARDMLGLI
jgi:hypothetical protein